MGFISGTSTVTVQAKLTDAGKKKMYESIEGSSGAFVTKFAIGDSDADYTAIENGAPSLSSGHVPEAGSFKPKIRSFALYKGTYRPGRPVVLVNDVYGTDNGVSVEMSIGSNESSTVTYGLKTEWPKNERFAETYTVQLLNPGNLSLVGILQSFFVITTGPNLTSINVQFRGGISDDTMSTLVGTSGSGNYTTIPLKVVGNTTHKEISLNLNLIH